MAVRRKSSNGRAGRVFNRHAQNHVAGVAIAISGTRPQETRVVHSTTHVMTRDETKRLLTRYPYGEPERDPRNLTDTTETIDRGFG